MKNQIKNTCLNVLILLIMTVICLGLAEGVLRFTSFNSLLVNANPNQFEGNQSRFYHRAVSDRGYDILPGAPKQLHIFGDSQTTIWSNELGCFDRPYQVGEEHILLLGDSFTWGYSEYDEKFGSRLEADLKLRVLKCGVSGYGTRQEYLKMLEVVQLTGKKPAAIVLMYFLENDFIDDTLFPQRTIIDGFRLDQVKMDENGNRVEIPTQQLQSKLNNFLKTGNPEGKTDLGSRFKNFINRHSILYILGKQFVKKALAKPVKLQAGHFDLKSSEAEPVWFSKAWDSHEKNLKAFKLKTSEWKVPFYLVYFSGKDIEWSKFTKARLENWISKEKVDALDLDSVFKNYGAQKDISELYWKIDAHWSPTGNKIVARALESFLRESKIEEKFQQNRR
jgi:hypothetical protein